MSLAVQLQDTGNVVAALGSALMITELVLSCRGDPRPVMECAAYALFVIANSMFGVGAVLQAQWGQAVWCFALAAFFAWMLRRRWRKHKDHVAALLGAKSRALRDALVRKQRELTRPRPVLRPVPQGGAA